MRRGVAFLLFLHASGTALAGSSSRFSLREGTFEPAADAGRRFSVQARFAPVDSAGELREGSRYVLIGKFNQAKVDCDGGLMFKDGFEG